MKHLKQSSMKHLSLIIVVLMTSWALVIVGSATGAAAVMCIGMALETGLWLGLIQKRRNRLQAIRNTR